MGDISFEVKNDALAVIQNLSIEANFDEVKTALTEMMEPYKKLVVTEDGISAAKSDRARIRKVATGIEDMRKNVKKLYSEPLAVFEGRCKELVSICADGANNLDGQIKAFEEAEAQTKIDTIRSVYDEGDAEVREYCTWERVYNDKWKNKGFSFDDAKDAILAEFHKTREDLATIRTLDENDVPALLTEYKRTRDIGAVIRMSNTLKQQREAEAKRRAEDAERRKIAQIEEAQRKNAEAAEQSTVVYHPSEETTDEPVRTVIFKVVATDRQLQSLKGFLRANGIEYSRP